MIIHTQLCICNKCNTLLIDTHPHSLQRKYHIESSYFQELTRQEDNEGVFMGCPICATDSYLMDFNLELDGAYKPIKVTNEADEDEDEETEINETIIYDRELRIRQLEEVNDTMLDALKLAYELINAGQPLGNDDLDMMFAAIQKATNSK